MPRPVICLYLVGDATEPIRDQHGSYVDWFARLMERHDVDMVAVDGHSTSADGTAGSGLWADPRAQKRSAQPINPADYDGIVITGSPASATTIEPWMEEAMQLIRAARDLGSPLFGICFGHQLIGAALGGRVVQNPRGWQISTHEIVLNDAGRSDPLFDGLPDRFAVNLSHRDVICDQTLPARAQGGAIEVLAGNAKAPVQAIAAGARMRGVQFHPEFSGPVTGSYIASRHDLLRDDAARREAPHDHPDRLLARLSDSPEGEKVLHNFLDHFVRD